MHPTFGDRFRNLRLDARLTQRALAFMLGVSRSYISKIEGDLATPNEVLLAAIIRVFAGELNRGKFEIRHRLGLDLEPTVAASEQRRRAHGRFVPA